MHIDPRSYSPEAIDGWARAANEMLEKLLAQQPPALFTVGTLDPLLDDTLFMAQRWLAAGNRADLAIYPGGVHGFNLFPTPLGDAALRRSEAFLADAFSGESK